MSIPKYNPVERITPPEAEPEAVNDHPSHSTVVKASIWLIATILLLGFWWKPALAVAIGMVGANSIEGNGMDLLLNLAENFDSILYIAVGLDLGMTLICWGLAVYTVKTLEPN